MKYMRIIIIINIVFILFFPSISIGRDRYKVDVSNIDSIVVEKYDGKKTILKKTITDKDSIAKIVNKYINKNRSVYIIKAICNYGLTIYYHDGQKKSMSILDKYFNPDTDGWHKMRRNVIKYIW